jgi:hypothetical protein
MSCIKDFEVTQTELNYDKAKKLSDSYVGCYVLRQG